MAQRPRSPSSSGSASAVEIVHAAVPGRLRVRVAALLGNAALVREVEQRFGQVAGVRAATGNARTACVLLACEASQDVEALRAALERACAELLAAWQPPEVLPSVVSTLPLHDATLRDALGALERIVAKLLPAAPGGAHVADPGSHQAAAAASEDEALASSVAWHVLAEHEVSSRLQAGREGLSEAEVARRRERYGPNALPAPRRRSKLAIFGAQFKTVPVAMLGVSALLSAATGGLPDAAAILVVVLANAGIGYVTESNAERVISTLGQGKAQEVEVLRAGARCRLPPEVVVPGDLLLLAAGTFVAADARLLEQDGLVIDESALTGESVPVHKHARALSDPRVPLADRLNMVFRDTLVTGGSGRALVVATGPATQIGQVQRLVTTVVQRETPLQGQLQKLGAQLAVVAGTVCGAVFGIGLLRGYPLRHMLGTSVSLAVAAIPEGLPTVAITTLALGIRHLAEQRVLVRELNAVETLGAIQVMCLDKTGTITVNRMSAAHVFAGMRDWDVQRQPRGPSSIADRDLQALLMVGVLCSEVEIETRGGVHVLSGSATESAIVQLALDSGLDATALRSSCTQLGVQYRSEGRSYMATLHRPLAGSPVAAWPSGAGSSAPPGLWVSVKGRSPEVLGMCRYYLDQGTVCELDDAARLAIETAGERMAGRALRVLGFAATRWEPEQHESPFALEGAGELVWLGLIGMSDPPREGMGELLQRFHSAGIRTVMITGDQGATAYAVGKAVGLSPNGHLEILDSTELEQIAPEVLRALAQRIHIFSRVSPAHKLQIVRALQSAGYTVAMTGDGINDSPALRAADVGVAMGGSGSSAAREVADVILEDDNLESMIGGIEQGRAIYEDIKKAVHFILSTNLSEILLTFVGITSGMGETLTPMQLLWINLMTDIFPELALAVQPPEADVLQRPPRDPARPMFDRADLARVAMQGSILATAPLVAYGYGRGRYGAGPRAGTLAFTVLAVTQLLHVVSSRSERHSIFDRERLAPNKYVPMALGGGLALQLLATLVPGLRRVLGVVPLGLADWSVVGLTAAAPLLANETLKLVLRPPSDASTRAAPSHNPG